MKHHLCYLGLGSNMQQPIEQIQSALEHLSQHPNIELSKVSRLFESLAVGPPQANYINAASEIYTSLTPYELLAALKTIEAKQQRVKTIRWGPRTIDLDILLFDNEQINTQQLCVPHPELKNRTFVLLPLYEIAPQLILPDGSHLQHMVTFINKTAEQEKERTIWPISP